MARGNCSVQHVKKKSRGPTVLNSLCARGDPKAPRVLWSRSCPASIPTAAITRGSASNSSRTGSRPTRWISAAAASPTASVFTSRQFSDYVERRGEPRGAREIARARVAGVPARPQRRRRRRLPLHARSPGGPRRADLRELRVHEMPAPGFCARGVQGAEPPRAARPRPAPEERGLLARSEGRAGDERRSADRARDAADADAGGDGSRRRAAEEGVPADHAAACSSSTAPPTRRPSRAAASTSTTRPARRDKTLKLYEGTSTICSTTSDKEIVMADILRWIDARVAASPNA